MYAFTIFGIIAICSGIPVWLFLRHTSRTQYMSNEEILKSLGHKE